MNPLKIALLTKAEYDQLVIKMIEWARSYYKFGEPVISDTQWDVHYAELMLFETTYPADKSQLSVVGKVGFAMFGESGVVPLNPPMLSLANRMSTDAAVPTIDKYLELGATLTLQLKADGNAARVVYSAGVPVAVSTRGDGISGDDITRIVAKGCKGIPGALSGKHHDAYVDGELVIKWDDFTKLNKTRVEQGSAPFKNPRNAVAGILNSLNPQSYEVQALSFISFAFTPVAGFIEDYYKELEILAEAGFEVIRTETIADANAFLIAESKYAKVRDTLDYMIDGLVVKIVQSSIRNSLGENSDSPNWAFSYKFAPEQKWTEVTSTGFTVGKTGQVTGMLYFKPVELGGVTVVKSSMDSYDRWSALQPGVGSMALVSRRADVRPYVEDIKSDQSVIPAPFAGVCPGCQNPLTPVGRKIYCNNHYCMGVRVAAMTYAFDKEILNVVNFSQATALTLYNMGVRLFTEAYMVTAERLVSLGAVVSVANRITSSIDDSRDTDMWRVIAAMGINSIGRTVSKSMAGYIIKNYGNTVDDLVKCIGDLETIQSFPIGVVHKLTLSTALQNVNFCMNLNNLKDCGFKFKEVGVLTGKRFCITGSFNSGIKRAVVAQRLKLLGATVQDSVTSDTAVLITDDPIDKDKGSTKMKKAIKLGVNIITSQQAIDEYKLGD